MNVDHPYNPRSDSATYKRFKKGVLYAIVNIVMKKIYYYSLCLVPIVADGVCEGFLHKNTPLYMLVMCLKYEDSCSYIHVSACMTIGS